MAKKPYINFVIKEYHDSYQISLNPNAFTTHLIKFKRDDIGRIINRKGIFKIYLMTNATPQQLEKNPNCNWAWNYLTLDFTSADEAIDFIKNNKEKIYSVLADYVTSGDIKK